MPISDMPVFSMLRTRLQWHQERQRVLAENVANANTPHFRPHDLAPPDFGRPVPSSPAVALALTDPAHLPGLGAATQFATSDRGPFEVRPAGNAVSLEDEMTKIADNQSEYQMVASLYQKSLALIRTAAGARGA